MDKNITRRIGDLRKKMRAAEIAATIIPHSDPHQSEYMSPHWHLREFFSRFSGSAGTLVVTLDEALLWTDSRYFLQAADQLEGSSIILMKDGLPETPTINGYISSALTEGSTVGIDAMTFSVAALDKLKSDLAKKGISIDTDFHPAEGIWNDRPPLPADKAFVHKTEYSGEEAASKIKRILKEVDQAGADSIFISALDEIAWLLNIRGNDVSYNPVVTSFLFLAPEGSTLFVEGAKIDSDVKKHLSGLGIETRHYDRALEFLETLPQEARVMVDPATSPAIIPVKLANRMIAATSPVKLPKAIRNDIQIDGLRKAMTRDGVALVNAFMEIERRLADGTQTTELDVCSIITRHRSLQPLYFDDSFGTIAGYRQHGAIVHYEPDEESDATLEPSGLLLIDSGAQYLDGTTDITRTISLGDPTPEECHDFTLVLMGHIDLASALFPEGTRGAQLDVLARQYLWKEGKTFLHGTGHGVGHFLNVHEGPQSIRLQENPVALQPGMLTSNEPGLYVTGKYGIRSENLILTVPALSTPDGGNFLRFETVTLFPFDTKLVDTTMMTEAQIKWLNDYHKRVYDTLSPHLSADAAQWLARKTEPVMKNPYNFD
ncbi:MAG: aminopeptidase P family protein [Lachnospiraceae bacterium]|nr:aminopeptidase P family protein [Lachnospiraceae bacterium]